MAQRNKLSDADVDAIRKRLDDGEKAADIADSYGVNKSTISRIKNAQAWRSETTESA